MNGADEAIDMVASILRIPTAWLEWPYIVTYIVIPLIFNTAGFYFFLNNRLRIFKSGGVNGLLAFIIAFVASSFGWWGMLIGVGMVALFGIEKWYNRAAFILLVYFIISLFYVGINTQMLFAVIGLLIVLLSFKISLSSPIFTWIVRIIVIIIGLVALSYLSQAAVQLLEGASLTYGI